MYPDSHLNSPDTELKLYRKIIDNGNFSGDTTHFHRNVCDWMWREIYEKVKDYERGSNIVGTLRVRIDKDWEYHNRWEYD